MNVLVDAIALDNKASIDAPTGSGAGGNISPRLGGSLFRIGCSECTAKKYTGSLAI